MKILEIRKELEARGLVCKGPRSALITRLSKALAAEKTKEEEAAKNEAENEEELTDDVTIISDSNEEMDTTEVAANESQVENNEEVNTTTTTTTTTVKEEEPVDNEDWTDVDMNDIVILDEYDANKKEDEPPKEMDEKEKQQMIRRYTLPNEPHIVVHPNRAAKGGKFDCSVMSLSVLLDYRRDDNKERSFEVSIFAEIFNEMLMRDFGFNIYKELYLHSDNSASTRNAKEEVANETENDATKATVTEDNVNAENANGGDKEKLTDNNAKTTTDAANDKSSRERRVSKRNHDDDSVAEDDSQSQKKPRRSDREREVATTVDKDKKRVVVKPHLLLSFVYFDSTHCGYIFEKDLEDLFYIIGLDLSRGQIRKLLAKLGSEPTICYRELTDREESVDATPVIEETDADNAEDKLRKIALGNHQFEFAFNNSTNDKSKDKNTAELVDTEGDLINYKGTIVNLGKLLDQIKRTEKNYSDLEKLYNDLRKQHADLQKDHSKSSGKMKELQAELKSVSRKLSDANDDLYSINRKYKDQRATISHIHNLVEPYIAREKEKAHKAAEKEEKEKEANRKDKDVKDKDKEKEKEKDKDAKESKEKVKKDVSEGDKKAQADKTTDATEETPAAAAEPAANAEEPKAVAETKVDSTSIKVEKK